jgi:hypothetical protein
MLCTEARSDEPLPSTSIVACSAASKMVASIATYPHEVVRTRLQTQKRLLASSASSQHPTTPTKYLGVIQTTKVICQEETWRGLYKGLSINLFRTVPNSVVTMLTWVIFGCIVLAGCLMTTLMKPQIWAADAIFVWQTPRPIARNLEEGIEDCGPNHGRIRDLEMVEDAYAGSCWIYSLCRFTSNSL